MASSGDCSEGGCAYGFLQYEPSLVGNAVLLALFAVLVPIAFALGIRYHSSIFSTTIITGLFLEIIGYAGRVLLATGDGGHRVDFALSHIGTILAPAFIALAVFRLMPPIVAAYGEQFRAWRPRWHNAVFYIFTAAVVALQVAGGVLSTVPASSTLNDTGIRLLVAGFAVHCASFFVFALLAARFAIAVRERRLGLDSSNLCVYNNIRFKAFLVGMLLATIILLVRTFFRMIVIAEGLSSALAQNETLFLVVDGVLVLVATTLLLGLFPGRLLASSWPDPATNAPDMTYKHYNRPAPIQLQQTTHPAPYSPRFSPRYNRISIKSNSTNSPKNSPRRSVPPQRNMVDSNTLW